MAPMVMWQLSSTLVPKPTTRTAGLTSAAWASSAKATAGAGGRSGMCENHANGAVRKAFEVKKATSSHGKGETVILTEDGVNESALRAAIDATGYEVKAASKEPHVKRGLFHR